MLSASNPSVLAVHSKQFSNHHHKPYTRIGFNECSFYKQKGHWKAQCPKLNNRIKLESLTANHNLMLIDHLRVINHHTTIPQQQLLQALLLILVLWLSNFRSFSHCSHKQCPLLFLQASCLIVPYLCHILNGFWILVLHIICLQILHLLLLFPLRPPFML